MPVYSFRTSNYARNIYIYGVTKFSDIDPEYLVPVKQYAAANYTIAPYATEDNRTRQIDLALNNGWITQEERDETVSYIVYSG